MKKIYILIPLLLFAILSYGQNSGYSFVPKDLKLLSMDETMEKLNSSQIESVKDIYYADGKRTTLNEAFNNYELFPQVFVDNNGKPQVIVFKKLSQQEMMELSKGMGGPPSGGAGGGGTVMGGGASGGDGMVMGQGMPNNMEMKDADLTGKKAKRFSVTDMEGNKYSLKKLKGKVVVVNFWFIDCKPCVEEMPELNKLVEEYKNNKDVVFLGFAQDNEKSLREFFKKHKFDYKIIPEGHPIAMEYQVQSFPVNLVIDKSSKIRYHSIGYSPNVADELKEKINKYLKKKK